MAATCNSAGHPKYNLRNSSDGLRIALPIPTAFGQQVHPRRSAFDGIIIVPTTLPESSSGREHIPYDVFINHHGKDTKHTLANSIYKKLDATGLRVFLDKNELELGDFFPGALEEAMASASFHIAIFSKNYAKSPWCLSELAFMLQTRVSFIPIFHHLEPSTLRWAIEGKGSYADAFKEHEMKGRYSSEKLQSWKLALHKASLYTGQTINNQGDEEKMVMNVVNRVLKELKKVRLDVAQHPVGLDEAVKDFHRIALQSAGPIQIVGIWGMGCAGKTTLAKQLYNKECSTIKKSSFLFDVREAATKGRLHEKQKKLLEDLDLKRESAIFDNTDEGKEILRSRLSSVSVLIVLDDVDHKDQLDALLPARNNLGHGSLIIVTTRELHVLRAWDISAIYKIRTLNPSHAKQLFCWHAFGQPSPLVEFKEIARKFINACDGLPLSLKVLGGLLYGESSEKYWQSQLDKLSRLVPNDIKSRLKISYDALDKEEQEMFLDVACFFIGWTCNRAITVWDGSEWTGLHGWQRLVDKCLVELDEYNCIRMHDHLRDLGREIANQQSPYRLWSKEQLIKIQPQQEAIGIRGMADAFGDNCYHRQGKIIINTSQGNRVLQPGSLGLKVFVGNGDFMNQECCELSRELICLCFRRFEHEHLPSWLSLKNLRILEIERAERLDCLWEPDADAPLQLRELVFRIGCQLKKIEGLGSLRSLETLIINDLTELKGLSILGELALLKMFDLKHCNKLEKIEILASQRSLETLRIHYCGELKTLPSLAEVTSLKELDLKSCHKLKIESLASLRSLETLRIHNCGELKTFPSLAEATSLNELDLKGCDKLEKIESLASLRSLETLRIHYCRELNTLSSLAVVTFLKEIDSKCCDKLEKIESLESPRSLNTLITHDRRKLNTLPSHPEPTSLRFLDLRCCNKLEKIGSLGSLITLETLIISDCGKLNTLPCLAEATSLKSLDLRDCYKLEKMGSLTSLRSLKTLTIHDCIELKTLPSFAESTSLKRFDLSDCNKLKKIESLASLRSLETLRICYCTELNILPSLAEAFSLKELDLRCCNKLEKIESLATLRSLETLIIHYCIELKTLPSLAEATSLKVIDLKSCNKLEKMESLENLKSLETLVIHYCRELSTLPSFVEATSLKNIDLEDCNKLEKIESLARLRSLETFIIHDCTELKTLPSLAEAICLKEIELKNCNKLMKVKNLGGLKSLETLKMENCPELDEFQTYAELSSLKEIELIKCHKLKKIGGLENLRSLKTLNIQDCPALDTLSSLVKLTSERFTSLKKLEVNIHSKVSCMFSLKHHERLKSVVVVANDRSAVEPFISGIQKWQREVIMCTRAVIDMISLKNFFTLFPQENVVEYGSLGVLTLSTLRSAANAILICFVIDYVHPNILFEICTDMGNHFSTEIRNGKWVWMGIFPEGSDWLQSNRYEIRALVKSEDKEVKVKEAWLLMSNEQGILESFHEFSSKGKES